MNSLINNSYCCCRKSKYEHGLPVFDLDAEIKYINAHGRLRTRREKIYSKLSNDPGDSAARVLDRFQVGFLAAVFFNVY